MGVILLAHSRIVKVEEPELDSYNKYEPDLDKRSCGMLQEWCDEVLFARYRVNTLKTDEGFNRERTRVIGQAGDRLVYTCEGPAISPSAGSPCPTLSRSTSATTWPTSSRLTLAHAPPS